MATSAREKAPPQRSDVFISYSRKDREFVKRLEAELQSRGREAWVDWEGIRPAEEFMQAIFPAIEGTDTFIFVLSPDSVTSEICGKELAHAVSHNKRMIPIMARDTDAKAVPESLAKLNWVFARDADSFEAAADFLISALDTDLDWVRGHTRLLTRALEWEAKGKNDSFVLRGDDLRAAELWLSEAGSDKERQPTPLQTTYIIASRKAAAKRQRILWGSVSVGLIIASAFAIAAYFQRQAAEQQRNIAAARQLSTEAGLTRDRRPNALQTSVLLAAQSLRRFPSMEADQVLRRSLWLLAVPVTRFTRENPARNAQFPVAEFSSDARLVALVLADFSVELREVATHRVIATLPHKDLINGLSALRFSADGKFLATGDFTTAFVWETGKGQAIGPPIPPGAPIKALAFSADNRLLVTGMQDQTVRISSLADGPGNASRTFKMDANSDSYSGSVDAVAVSPDGKYLLTSWRKDVTRWDAATGRQIGPAGLPDTHSTHNRHPDTLVFSPDGTTFASAGTRDAAVCLFDSATGRELFVLPQFAEVTRVAFSPSGKYFATVSNDLAARVWEATGAHRLIATVVHEAPITALAFSPDEQSLATASGDNTARVWDIGSSRETLRMIHQQPVRAIAFTPDGASVATAGEDGMVALWKSKTGPELAQRAEEHSPTAVRFSPDGQTVATMMQDRSVIWESMTGNAVALSATGKAPRFALTEDLRLAASASGETAEVWDVPSRKPIATLEHKPPIDWAEVLDRPSVTRDRTVRSKMAELRDRGSVEVVAFSPDGHLLLTRRLDDEGRIWDVTTGAEKWRFQNFTPRKLASFSRDGRLLAIAAGDAVRIFDAQSGKEQAAISKALGSTEAGLLAGDAKHLVFSAGNRLAVVGHDSLLIWSEEGRRIVDLKFEHHVTAFASSPDSQLIATAHAGGAVEIWSAEDGSRIDTIPPHGETQSLAFSPDGTLLATGGDDFFARVREPRKHQEIAAFKHLDAVLCVAFSADGKLLATGSQDQTTRVWDIRANDATAVINHPPRLSREGPRICAVALSPNSRYLVSGEQGGMVCVWPLQPADLIKQAAARITRPLADEERKALEAAQ